MLMEQYVGFQSEEFAFFEEPGLLLMHQTIKLDIVTFQLSCLKKNIYNLQESQKIKSCLIKSLPTWDLEMLVTNHRLIISV